MDILKIIESKASGKKLSQEEIDFFVNGYVHGDIADYQMSALLMAIKLKGMDIIETTYLTKAMVNSGEILDLSDLGFVVDKHSSGGISDTTSIAIAPICAVAGVNMLKLSGRGLGFTGGTIDKLESFTGFNVDISMEKAKEIVNDLGACIISANLNLAPADKKIYALRNVTGTIDSIPLIASSIMSKKIASGADAIVLDVKYGNGAFMKTKKDAKKLAKLMKKIGEGCGRKVDYVIGDMNEPLGYNIGNSLEAYEAIEVLMGKQSKLYNTVVELSSKCISLAKNITEKQAKTIVEEIITSGKALEKLKQIVKTQGGSLDLFNGIKTKPTLTIKAENDGKIKKIVCDELGFIVSKMGANRQKLTDKIDYNVGVKTYFKLNDKVKQGDTILEIYAKNKKQAEQVKDSLKNCFVIE